MNILALDTSSPVLSVALKTGAGEISETRLTGFLQHAENLLPLIDRLLKKQKISPAQIDRFLIGRGPGSFTGLRVGFATLKGFLSVQPKHCYGGTSLDMIAENIALPEKSGLAVCLDAGRERFFVRLYRRVKQSWCAKSRIQVLTPAETAALLPQNVFIAGDALRRHQEKLLESAAGKNLKILPETSWYPKASTLIHWAMKKNPALVPLKAARDFLPFYSRLSEPEERRRHAAACC